MARWRPGSLSSGISLWSAGLTPTVAIARACASFPAGFHRLRITIKRFRYIVENFLPLQHAAWSDDLKHIQDLLGDVHDLDVLWFDGYTGERFP